MVNADVNIFKNTDLVSTGDTMSATSGNGLEAQNRCRNTRVKEAIIDSIIKAIQYLPNISILPVLNTLFMSPCGFVDQFVHC